MADQLLPHPQSAILVPTFTISVHSRCVQSGAAHHARGLKTPQIPAKPCTNVHICATYGTHQPTTYLDPPRETVFPPPAHPGLTPTLEEPRARPLAPQPAPHQRLAT